MVQERMQVWPCGWRANKRSTNRVRAGATARDSRGTTCPAAPKCRSSREQRRSSRCRSRIILNLFAKSRIEKSKRNKKKRRQPPTISAEPWRRIRSRYVPSHRRRTDHSPPPRLNRCRNRADLRSRLSVAGWLLEGAEHHPHPTHAITFLAAD